MSLEQIVNKLVILETRHEERWNAHDQRSSENWNDIKNELGIVNQKLNVMMDRPCIKHAEKFNAVDKEIGTIWKTVTALWVFVSSIALAILAETFRVFGK